MRSAPHPSFASLRTSILTALGLAACGGNVILPGATGSGGAGTTAMSGSGGAGTTAMSGSGGAGTTAVSGSGGAGNTAVSGSGGAGATSASGSGGNTSASGTGGSGNTSTSASGTGGAGGIGGCDAPMTVLTSDGSTSGLVRCGDGAIDKAGPATCNLDTGITACTGDEGVIQCSSDADCTAGPHGRCAFTVPLGSLSTYCACVYPCADDAECGDGKACICGGIAFAHASSFCAPAECQSGSDCASGECGLSDCFGNAALACRDADDKCHTTKQCSAFGLEGCALVGGSFACKQCSIGRPLLVDGNIRVAAPIARADWLAAGPAPATGHLDASTREALAARWLAVAALEHASVASFARFTLELLSLGAPAALVAGAQQAGLDEVEHARIAYAMAVAYGGGRGGDDTMLGPGALDLTGVTLHADRRAVVRALITEGCVGETLGVAEALTLADAARDPALQRVYARIAADEQRHAELAFRALAWLLADADADLVRFAAACFEEAAAGMSCDPPPAPVLPEHGLLAAAALGAVRRRALADVVRPCADALLWGRSGVRAIDVVATA